MKMVEHRQRLILRHATVAALTTLIPIPFLDDAAKRSVERRMVRQLADIHGLRLVDSEVAVLADDDPTPILKGLARKAAFMPVRWVLKKAMVVFTVKAVVDTASDVYHRGFLFDHAFEQKHCAPAGEHAAGEIRRAVDAVCKEVRTGPVERALARAYGPSKDALFGAYDRLRRGLSTLRGEPTEPDVAEIVEREESEDRAISEVVEEAWRRLRELPDDTFDDLRQRLNAKLRG